MIATGSNYGVSFFMYTLRCLKLRFSRVKTWSVSFASGRREFRFPTVAIRRSLLQTFGAQLRKINRCGVYMLAPATYLWDLYTTR